MTAHPSVAAISTFAVFLLLWMFELAGNAGQQNSVLNYLAITKHYQPLVKGLFSTADVVYYVLFIALFLILSIKRLDAERF